MPNKYGATKVTIDGKTFDSKREYTRYGVLVMKQKAGLISGLQHHPPAYPLEVNGTKIGRYQPDFVYFDNDVGHSIVEDVKSPMTKKLEAYRLRIKVFRALYPDVDFREV
jgi:hypothetical protein